MGHFVVIPSQDDYEEELEIVSRFKRATECSATTTTSPPYPSCGKLRLSRNIRQQALGKVGVPWKSQPEDMWKLRNSDIEIYLFIFLSMSFIPPPALPLSYPGYRSIESQFNYLHMPGNGNNDQAAGETDSNSIHPPIHPPTQLPTHSGTRPYWHKGLPFVSFVSSGGGDQKYGRKRGI